MIIRRVPGQLATISLPVLGADKVYVVIEETVGNQPYVPISAYEDEARGDAVAVNLMSYMRYDRELTISIFDENGGYISETPVSIVRPYVTPDPSLSIEEQNRFWHQEEIARYVIDSVTGGFYHTRKVIGYESSGGDALPLRGGVTKIYRAWVNDELVYDSDAHDNTQLFTISADGNYIVIGGKHNRRYGNDTRPHSSPSDYLPTGGGLWYRAGAFPRSYDYLFDVEYGYRSIPNEIVMATNMLMSSGKCTDAYLNKYILEYSTDQYRIKYDRQVLKSTGDRVVDKLLYKFVEDSALMTAGVV